MPYTPSALCLGGQGLFNFQGFFLPESVGPKFSVFCLPLTLGPLKVEDSPPVSTVSFTSCGPTLMVQGASLCIDGGLAGSSDWGLGPESSQQGRDYGLNIYNVL